MLEEPFQENSFQPSKKVAFEQMQSGILGGFPLIDVKVTVYDGSFHDVDSSEIAFKVASSMALKDGALKANPVILEPIMKYGSCNS